MNLTQTIRWRVLRRCLVGLGVCVTLTGLFYTEELWRGKRAWDNCQRVWQAQGVDLNWNHYIPAPVPDEENVFGVPEMQKWFVGRGVTELSKRLSYPGNGANTAARLTIAELTIGLPGASASSYDGSAVLQWGDPQAKAEAARLIKDALGPVVTAPAGYDLILRPAQEIRPAKIFLKCQTAPTQKELLHFLPQPIGNTTVPENERIQVEPAGNGFYIVTMVAPVVAADFLGWSGQFEPEFAIIRQALQRPSLRMAGSYTDPFDIPIAGFVTERSFVHTLGARAQCHFLLGQGEDALRDLTLMHDSCRIMVESRPMTLVGAMINVAVAGLYTSVVADGVRMQIWREPQLAVLEEQLKQINLLPPVKQALETERVAVSHTLATAPSRALGLFLDQPGRKFSFWKSCKNTILNELFPRGWVYQNLATGVDLHPDAITGLDRASQLISPEKFKAYGKKFDALRSHWSPYTFMAVRTTPNYDKAVQTTARNQTMVNEALIVCALERYRLARGRYPENLDALAPQFIDLLPHDVLGGEPLHYRCAADGKFLLYSVGWNGRDDGGVRGKSMDGDWVWPISL